MNPAQSLQVDGGFHGSRNVDVADRNGQRVDSCLRHKTLGQQWIRRLAFGLGASHTFAQMADLCLDGAPPAGAPPSESAP